MQSHLVSLARIAAIGLLLWESFLLAPSGKGAASADPVDDLLLEAAVKAAFSLDPYLSILPVTVSAMDGRVTVTGKLGHPAQKRLVMRKVGGVVGASVIVDKVSLPLLEPSDGTRTSAPGAVVKEDKAQPAVGEGMEKRPGIAVSRWRVAESLRRLKDRLAERPEPSTEQGWKERLHDRLTAARARRVLDRNLLSPDVQIDVRDGVVTLRGEVLAEDDVSLAGQLVEGLSGVASVKNELRVKK